MEPVENMFPLKMIEAMSITRCNMSANEFSLLNTSRPASVS